jgi:hypothetical protein
MIAKLSRGMSEWLKAYDFSIDRGWVPIKPVRLNQQTGKIEEYS